MNLGTKSSILAFGLLVGAGLFLQSCTGPTFDLKPTATGGGAPCGLGTSYKEEITLGGGSSGVAEGTTAGGTNVVDHGKCGREGGIDAVYKLVVTEPLGVSIELCSDFDVIFYSLWRVCPSDGDPVLCGGDDSECVNPEICLESGTYYVAVEGYDDNEGLTPTTGPFTIYYGTYGCDY